MNQGNKNEPKWFRNEESKHELEGRKRRTRRTQHEPTNRFLRQTPEDTRRIRDLLSLEFLVLALIHGLVDLSLTQAPRGRNPQGENENRGGKRDEGSLILFNRAITQSQFCS
jgi:hypothetical protein